MNVIKKLKIVLNKKQKQRVILLCILIMIGALLETLGVGVISPLISAVVSPETILENDVVKTILSITGMEDISNEGFVRILLLVTIAVFIFKNAYLLFVSFVQSRFIAWTQSSTSVRLMGDYLNRPYEYYLNADVNVMIQTVNKDIPHIFELLQEFMLLITEIAVSFCICTFLLVLAPVMTLSLAALLGVMILLILLVFKPRLRDLGHERIDAQNNMMKWMQQSVFGIKDVKVAAKENYFLGRFEKGSRAQANASGKYTVMNNFPRLVIETFSIVGLLLYMFISVLRGKDLQMMMPELTAFGLAAVRLIPAVNRISTHLSAIAYYEPSLNLVCDNLDLANLKEISIEDDKPSRINLTKDIKLQGIYYRYPNTEKDIFANAEMDIPVGSSIGVIGPSGAGKTTIVDILLGLLLPQKGEILVDGQKIKPNDPAWISNIGYIAQNIYMLDTSIRENVAFGIDPKDADEDRIWKVLEEAQMADFIRSLPDGLDTMIGDRGVRISGGQRQRIGIARALYNDPDLLVFDEATSALDNETEAAIMEAIGSLKGRKTMVIIAHRLKTIENCDKVYRVENGLITVTDKV